jgi:malate/lactate dehydrogenase
MCVSVLCNAILHDTAEVFPVSTSVKGLYGIKVRSGEGRKSTINNSDQQEEVFISLPAVLSFAGVQSVVNINLAPEESAKLNESINTLLKIQANVKFDK